MRAIAPEIDVRRAADRFHTRIDRLDSKESVTCVLHGALVTAVEPAEVLVWGMHTGVAHR